VHRGFLRGEIARVADVAFEIAEAFEATEVADGPPQPSFRMRCLPSTSVSRCHSIRPVARSAAAT
jgi:hypothetical protein